MDFDGVPLERLRQRQSIKWQLHPPDVLPLWVAELDVELAPAVRRVLEHAVAQGDTGYPEPTRMAEAFSRFARRRWGWEVKPHWCFPVGDVMTGVLEALKVLTAPGDGVVICPPVYHPFFVIPEEAGRRVVPVPLVDDGLDLAGIDAELAAGARAVLLCSPHNPTGRVWTPEELAALDEVAQRHDAVVISDEIHAPLTLAGATFTPYLRDVRRNAVTVVSASKAFNLAGLKAALVVAGSPALRDRLATMPVEVQYRIGHLGVLASVAAYDDGDEWLDGLCAHLDRQRALLGQLLPPSIGYTPPQASYLAWLHFGEPAPAARLLEQGRVALVEGTDFGLDGYARLNFGTTSEVLTEAVRRIRA